MGYTFEERKKAVKPYSTRQEHRRGPKRTRLSDSSRQALYKASRDRREEISVFEGDPRFGRPVTYVDVLVDELVAVTEKKA